MSVIITGNRSHDAALQNAETARQVAESVATTQTALNAAAVAYHRAALTSAIKNGCGTQVFINALRSLGYPGG